MNPTQPAGETSRHVAPQTGDAQLGDGQHGFSDPLPWLIRSLLRRQAKDEKKGEPETGCPDQPATE
jgi:hypothetical protein